MFGTKLWKEELHYQKSTGPTSIGGCRKIEARRNTRSVAAGVSLQRSSGADDDDLTPTEHVAKVQRLGDRSTMMETGSPQGRSMELVASAAVLGSTKVPKKTGPTICQVKNISSAAHAELAGMILMTIEMKKQKWQISSNWKCRR